MAAIWRAVEGTNIEVSDDGRVRRNGVERIPCIGKNGYRRIGINKRVIELHRLIATAFIPNPSGKPLVDHIDGNKLNNEISNLRWVTRNENMWNRKPHSKKSDLPRGVHRVNRSNKYSAIICHKGKNHYLGTFDTPEEAAEVYEVTAQELFGEFYRPLILQ